MPRRATTFLLLLAVLLGACRSADHYEPSDAVEIVVRGNRAYDRDEVLAVMGEDLTSFEEDFAKSALDDAAWRLQEFLRSEGYATAEVAYDLVEEGRARPLATFTVQEGPRVAIHEDIDFQGAEAFDDERLAAYVLEPDGLFRTPTTWYVEGRLRSVRDELESLYIGQGYVDVRVAEPTVTFSENGEVAHVTLQIEEGAQYTIAGVELEGVDQAMEAKVRNALKSQVGEPWYARRSYTLLAAVSEVYANSGHPDADVQIVVPDPMPTEVVPKLIVDPGPEVRIGEIHIEGAERTRVSFIRSRLVLEPGDRFDRSRERKSFSRLLGTGLFGRVEITRKKREGGEATEEGYEVHDLVVEVEELPAREIFVEPGYGSYEMLRMRVGAADRNMFGYGQTARTEATISQRSWRGEVGYIWPALFGSDLVLDGRAFIGEREEPSFVREDLGTEWRLTRPFTTHIKATLGYEFRQSAAEDIDAIQDDEEDVLLSVLSLSPSFDSRNRIFWPTGGTLVRLKTEWSDEVIGSELDYVRLLGNLSDYHELSSDFTLAWSYRSGLIFPTRDTEDIPIQERFFNGGESTVRSYKESELGPKDANGEPLGGEVFNVLSGELRYGFGSNWQAALFVDAGNVEESVSDWGQFSEIGYGVGLGIRWLLPIGPIRLDFGLNPNPAPGEDDYRIHFSVGSPY